PGLGAPRDLESGSRPERLLDEPIAQVAVVSQIEAHEDANRADRSSERMHPERASREPGRRRPPRSLTRPDGARVRHSPQSTKEEFWAGPILPCACSEHPLARILSFTTAPQ